MKKVLFVLAAAACMVACGNKEAKAEAAEEEVIVAEEVVAEEPACDATIVDTIVAAVEGVQEAADAVQNALQK